MFPVLPRLALVLCLATLAHARNESIKDPARCSRLPQEHIRNCLEQICSHGRFDFEVIRLTQNGAVLRPFADSAPPTRQAACRQDPSLSREPGRTPSPPLTKEALERKRQDFRAARTSAFVLGGAGLTACLLGAIIVPSESANSPKSSTEFVFGMDSITIRQVNVERTDEESRKLRQQQTFGTGLEILGGIFAGLGLYQGIRSLILRSDLREAERNSDPKVELLPALSPTHSSFAMIVHF